MAARLPQVRGADVKGLALVAPQIAISHEKSTVLIELICADSYGALVLYDDILSRMNSPAGFSLSVKTTRSANERART
jgi:hypothetical protein